MQSTSFEICHPTERVMMEYSTFETYLKNLVFPARYNYPAITYTGRVMVCVNELKEISYIDALEKCGKYEGMYFMAVERANIPQEFKDWFANLNKKNMVDYTCATPTECMCSH